MKIAQRPVLWTLITVWLMVASYFVFVREPAPTTLSLAVHRKPGAQALWSRCTGCTQIGDTLTAGVYGGTAPSGIRLYWEDTLIAKCDHCASLATQVDTIGTYTFVGYQNLDARVTCDGTTYDKDAACLLRHGATTTTQRFTIR